MAVKALPVHGVDISHHQGGHIDWAAAKRAGVQFVYHKATEGDSYVDPMYVRRRKEVKTAGLPFGAYHFARPEVGDANIEATRFIKTADPQPGDLIPALDLETTEGLTQAQLETWAEAFSKKVKALTGYWPVVYTPYLFSKGRVPGARWVPRYNNDNRPPTQTGVDIWQFSNGVLGVPNKVAGLGNVDLNTFRNATQLKDIVMAKEPVKPPTKPPVKPPVKSEKLFTMHFSLQYSITKKQKQTDVEKIFARANAKNAAWVTGTEAGAKELWDIVTEVGEGAGFKLHRCRDNWIAVRKSIIKKDSWVEDEVFVEVKEEVVGIGHDSAFAWVTFEHKTPGIGVISIAAVHYPTKGRVPGDPNHWVNKKYAKALGDWGQAKAKGQALAFVQGDFNMPDQKQIDLFFDRGFTTYGDELKKWPNTGHGPIDAMATWDKDGRVKVLTYNVLDDKTFFLHGDHFGIEGSIQIGLVKVPTQ